MYSLYHHFIQKIKEEEIQKYNQKHKAYLIRSGKLKQNFNNANNSYKNKNNQNIYAKNSQVYQNQFMDKAATENIQIKKQQSKPRRQRQFNKNPRKNQKLAQLAQPSIQFQSLNVEKERLLINDKRYKNVSENFQYSKDDSKQMNTDERPLKQNKLTQQQMEYLQQTQNQNKFQDKQTQIQSRQQQPKFMKKAQNQQQKQKPYSKIDDKAKQLPQVYQFKQNQLAQCQSCGRKFRPQILAKHQKNCQKVFVEKRKPFQVKKTDQQAQMLKKKSDKQNPDESQANKKAKWKKQSQKFRNMLKAGRGEKVEAPEDDRIQCPGCGRKFSENAAAKHIQFCTKKKKK